MRFKLCRIFGPFFLVLLQLFGFLAIFFSGLSCFLKSFFALELSSKLFDRVSAVPLSSSSCQLTTLVLKASLTPLLAQNTMVVQFVISCHAFLQKEKNGRAVHCASNI
jgi:hypothetical protein